MYLGNHFFCKILLIRESISLVHGHQAFSTLCHEALMHARTMGYKVVFTDHSLYGFADVGSIHTNKVLQFTLADVSQAICVSHTSKENTVLRSGLPPEKVFVIPNAVDTAMFKPTPERLSRNEIVIVVISRLVYRKGADLLVEVIPEICHLYPNVLPDDMIVLAKPDPFEMVQAIKKAMHMLPHIPQTMHLCMKNLYSWRDVAKRTEIVYDHALRCRNQNILERLLRYLTCGAWAGKLFCLVMIIDFILWHLLQMWQRGTLALNKNEGF